jgi:putative spermidine/putrescine transport system ATP-binding protein
MAALTSAILSDVRAGGSDATRAGAKIKLSIRSVGKSYGAVAALADASLELAEGELLTLLGPSGSGKTTLLMTVAGLVPPSSGEIWIDGSSPPTFRPTSATSASSSRITRCSRI